MLACATPAVQPSAVTAKQVKVVRRGVVIGSTLVRLPGQSSALVEALGVPSRTEELTNRILTWDELGVYAFLYPDDGRVHAIAFSFECKDLTFCPGSAYAGKIAVGSTEVPQVLDEQRFREAGFDFDAGWWVRRVGRVEVSVAVNDDHNGVREIQVER
jgi:hypothetical protein